MESQSQQQEFKHIALSIEKQLIDYLNEQNLETNNAFAFIGTWNKTYHHGYSANPFKELVKQSLFKGRIYIVVGHYFEHLGLMLALDEQFGHNSSLVGDDILTEKMNETKYLVIGVDIEHYDPSDSSRYFRGLFSDDAYQLIQRAFGYYVGIFPSAPLNDDIDQMIGQFMRPNTNINTMSKIASGNSTQIGLIVSDGSTLPIASPKLIRLPVEAYYLFDAIMLYGQVLKECLIEKKNATLDHCLNGNRLSENIRKQIYNSSMGFVSRIDSNGDAEGNYTLVARRMLHLASERNNKIVHQQEQDSDLNSRYNLNEMQFSHGHNQHNSNGLLPVGIFVYSTSKTSSRLKLPQLVLHTKLELLNSGAPKLNKPQLRVCTKHIESICRNLTSSAVFDQVLRDQQRLHSITILLSFVILIMLITLLALAYYRYLKQLKSYNKLEQCSIFVASEVLVNLRRDLCLITNIDHATPERNKSQSNGKENSENCTSATNNDVGNNDQSTIKLALFKENLVAYKKFQPELFHHHINTTPSDNWRYYLEQMIKLRLNLVRERAKQEEKTIKSFPTKYLTNCSRSLLSGMMSMASQCVKFRSDLSKTLGCQQGHHHAKQHYETIQMMVKDIKLSSHRQHLSSQEEQEEEILLKATAAIVVDNRNFSLINNQINNLLSALRQIRHANVLPMIGLAYDFHQFVATTSNIDSDKIKNYNCQKHNENNTTSASCDQKKEPLCSVEDDEDHQGRRLVIDCFVLVDHTSRGSLRDVLCGQNLSSSLSIFIVISLVNDLLRGLDYMHTNLPSIGYHGNLKATNCLVDSRWTLKLSDFYQTHLNDTLNSSYGIQNTTSGANNQTDDVSRKASIIDNFDHSSLICDRVDYEKYIYMAPELLEDVVLMKDHAKQDRHNATATSSDWKSNGSRTDIDKKYERGRMGDIYSLGFVLYELLTCREPWSCYFEDAPLSSKSKRQQLHFPETESISQTNANRHRYIVEVLITIGATGNNFRPPLDKIGNRWFGHQSTVIKQSVDSYGSSKLCQNHHQISGKMESIAGDRCKLEIDQTINHTIKTMGCYITYELLFELGTQIIRWCWSAQPSQRPLSIGQIRQMMAPVLDYRANKSQLLHKVTNGIKIVPSHDSNSNTIPLASDANGRDSNHLMDNMLYLMDIYTNNLELIIDERTEQLQSEKARANRLLNKMLPPVIAKKLCLDQPIEAELFECVSVLFVDIVDFTQLSSMSTPIETIEFLNDLYSAFDTIINQYDNIYKVETIGDCLMLASGVPLRNGLKHACLLASLALDLLDEAKKYTIKHLPDYRLTLRCGLHCGPVCAGLVGSREQPKYSLFGDTINMASRMQSTGLPQKVQLTGQFKATLLEASEFIVNQIDGIHHLQASSSNSDKLMGSTSAAISADYVIIKRGLVQIKGKGEILTYWLLNGPRYHSLRGLAR